MEDIIGILGAMPEEVDQLCALLDGVTIEPYAGVEYHQGYLGAVSYTHLPLFCTPNLMKPPSGVNLMALSKRLYTTWYTRSGSA